MTDLIANMNMYCWRENKNVWDGFWAEIQHRLLEKGIDAPQEMSTAASPWEDWEDTNLLLGHTCGWPYVSRLREKVSLVGTFDFGLDGCPPGFYRSVFIASKHSDICDPSKHDLLSGKLKVAVNGTDSQSGFRAFSSLLEGEPARLLREDFLVITRSHRNSIRAVAQGEADIAAIDGVTWEMALQFEPSAKDVRVVGYTPAVPGLPLITANDGMLSATVLFKIVEKVLSDNSIEIANGMPIKQLIKLEDEVYLRHLLAS